MSCNGVNDVFVSAIFPPSGCCTETGIALIGLGNWTILYSSVTVNLITSSCWQNKTFENVILGLKKHWLTFSIIGEHLSLGEQTHTSYYYSPYRLWFVGRSSPDGSAPSWVPIGDGWWTYTWKMTSSWTRSTATWTSSMQRPWPPPLACRKWNPWSVSHLSWMCSFLRWAKALIRAHLCCFALLQYKFCFYIYVLCPPVQAIIHAIAGVNNVSVKKAEESYMKGRSISNR